ncbi:sigma-54-dependent transcriptional regulator [Candidatus Liberibacter brunswickensis]|uniref:sigma-54-dependent transcriptional regulator n=1 Tax=Candidatus Liberibacter brunswickensis TaxID=1968796 RepID=UPI002FE185F2
MTKENNHIKYDVFIIDNDKDISNIISSILLEIGYTVHISYDIDSAFAEIKNCMPKFVLLNIRMVGYIGNSLSFLDRVKEIYPSILVVMISDLSHVDMAIASIKRGSFDFIDKPIRIDQVYRIIDKVIGISRISNISSPSEIKENLIGESAPISNLRKTVNNVSINNSHVMIFGAAGSGKKLIARLIHRGSLRAKKDFILFDAANMSAEFMEISLFGIENSAGGVQKIGCLEQAFQGTIYINEIVNIPCCLQDKILDALVESKFKRVNGKKNIPLDIRIISSTSVNPRIYIVRNLLKEDLYYILSAFQIRVPSLVEIKEDIPLLANYLICQICQRGAINIRYISNDVMEILQNYNWPGNVRELRSYLEKIIFIPNYNNSKLDITTDMLVDSTNKFFPITLLEHDNQIINLSLRQAREVFEKNYLIAQINRFNGNISRTAEFIGMDRSALHRKLKLLGL